MVSATSFTVNVSLVSLMHLIAYSLFFLIVSAIVTEMTSSNNPRFRLLVGWCCLMTSALLIVTVYLAIENLQKKVG